jgi:hypothetical protein
MGKYVYQIQGALEDEHQVLHGLRVIVCDVNNMEIVDVPIKVLDKETIKYLSFRLKLTSGALVIQNLPNGVINKIRMLLGKYLDNWVLINFYGHTSNTKSVNP